MNSRKALVVAVLAIFAAAMVAELAGLVHREPVTASATEDGLHAHGGAETTAQGLGVSEKQLRIGVMGAFVCVCFFAVMRYRGAL